MKTIIYNNTTNIIIWSGESSLYKSPEFDGGHLMTLPGATLVIDVPEEVANVAPLEVGTFFPGMDISNLQPVAGIPVETL